MAVSATYCGKSLIKQFSRSVTYVVCYSHVLLAKGALVARHAKYIVCIFH